MMISYNSFAQKTWEDYGFKLYSETKDSITLMGIKKADGQIVVPPRYSVIMPLAKGGYAYVANPVDKKLTDNRINKQSDDGTLQIFMGLIDSTAKVAIEPTQYNGVAYFPNDNLVIVVKGDKRGIYSLSTKRIEVPVEFDKINIYVKDLPAASVEKSKKFGIYNMDLHKLVVPCLFDESPSVQYDNWEKTDRKIIGYQVRNLNPLRSGYLDANGNVLIDMKFTAVYWEYSGTDFILGVMFNIPDKNNNYTMNYFSHYFKTNAIKISTQQYKQIGGFGADIPNALVNINGKWGLINCITEKFVIEPQFDSVKYHYRKSFVAYKNNKPSLYDFSGKEMIFDIIKECKTKDDKEYLSVCKNRRWGCLDYKLNYIIPLEYDREVIPGDQM